MNTLGAHDPTPPPRCGVVLISTARRWFRSGGGLGGMQGGFRVGSIAMAVVVLAVASACVAAPADTPPTPTITDSPMSTTPSPSTSVSPRSESELAAADAELLVHEYYRVIDELGSDPVASLSQLDGVAISKDLDSWKRQLERNRRDSYIQTGSTHLSAIEVSSVNLDNSDPATGRVPTVQVDVCFDVSDVDVLDASGASIVTAERPDTGWIRHMVSNYSWDTDPTGGWRVSTSVDLERAPCEAPG
jgi:hypothetical protein